MEHYWNDFFKKNKKKIKDLQVNVTMSKVQNGKKSKMVQISEL